MLPPPAQLSPLKIFSSASPPSSPGRTDSSLLVKSSGERSPLKLITSMSSNSNFENSPPDGDCTGYADSDDERESKLHRFRGEMVTTSQPPPRLKTTSASDWQAAVTGVENHGAGAVAKQARRKRQHLLSSSTLSTTTESNSSLTAGKSFIMRNYLKHSAGGPYSRATPLMLRNGGGNHSSSNQYSDTSTPIRSPSRYACTRASLYD